MGENENKESETNLSKVKKGYWESFFNSNYNLPKELSQSLAEHFNDELSEDFEVTNEVDYNFQRDVIRLCIGYSKNYAQDGRNKCSNWIERYNEVAVEFSGKSLADILKGE